jgi:hypothetical protein
MAAYTKLTLISYNNHPENNRGQFFILKSFEKRWNLLTELANQWVISNLLFLSLLIASRHREARTYSQRLSKPLRYFSKFLAVSARKLSPKGPQVCLSQYEYFLLRPSPPTETSYVQHYACRTLTMLVFYR